MHDLNATASMTPNLTVHERHAGLSFPAGANAVGDLKIE